MDTKNDIPESLTEEETKRYSRQILLEEMSEESQLKLKQAKVLVIGSGGLGSPCLTYLAGAGVGTIGIVDNDVVDITNLHRQVIHSTQNHGIPKVLSAKNFLSSLNPNTNIITYNELITNKNGLEIAKDYDLIIDCCDNPKTRYLTNDIAVILNKPFISGASVRWDGQLSLYVKDAKGNKLPCYRCLNPKPPLTQNVKKCSQVGVMGTIPGVIGVLMANEAIKFIIRANEQLLTRKMLIFDGYDTKFKIVKCRDYKEDCVVCGTSREINKDNFDKFDYDIFINQGK